MLRIIHSGNALPASYPVDATSTFQPGCIGQFKLIGNDIVIGLSDGTAPIGIIDDIRTTAFTQSIVDEIVIIPGADIYMDAYQYYNGKDSIQLLANAPIVASSFIADYDGLVLTPINGALTLPEDSLLNWDSDGDHINDSVKTIVNYVYQVASLAGDDTTVGSGRLTLWYQRGIFETDMFDTLERYSLGCTLFVNSEGKLTSKQESSLNPGIAICSAPPSAMNGTIEFIWM